MIGFISDIHGNYPALRAVINKLEEFNCDIIYSLGDVVGYYCMVNECISLLREKQVINILGNHDDYLVNGVPEHETSKTVRLCIQYQKGIIHEESLKWLKKSNEYYDDDILSLRHAGWNDLREERFSQFDFTKVRNNPRKLFLSGHSHIQTLQIQGKKIYCNPGSVGQPRDGNPDAAFAILDDGKIELMRVSYDIDDIVAAMKHEQLGEWIYRGLYIGKGV